MIYKFCLPLMLGTLAATSAAQDTLYQPRGQQIPPPACMNLHNAWEGPQTTCPPFAHERWLNDLQHWRAERRIRIAYDPARYELPALEWTQSSFMQPQMMVHDRYFYDPSTGHYTVDRYLGRSRKTLRRHRCRPHLGDLSQYGDRRPQSARNGRVHAGRHRRRPTNGYRLSPAWRPRSFPDDDVGRRHTPARATLAAIARSVDEGDRCRRRQRRHAGWRSARLLACGRCIQPSSRIRAGRRPQRRSTCLERDDLGSVFNSISSPP